MVEVLAPAGDVQAFQTAVNCGADAIYIGLTDFSARKSAANFSLENLSAYTSYAHIFGVKVYVAMNTLVKDEEADRFFDTALAAWNAGADALIIQDVFLGKLLHTLYPEMVLHLSTQAGVCNLYGAQLAKRYGFSRVILARETPFADIEKIAREIETEIFVQGALCTCFSGQCYLSSFIGGNSGNRGFCKQPCRKRYKINRKGFESLSYKLSLSDLSLGKSVLSFAKAGVVSFKIEGRMRSSTYVGSAVKYYKDIFSGASQEKLASDISDVKRAFNRGNYTLGYANGQDKNLISSNIQGHIGEKIGTIVAIDSKKKTAFVQSSFIPSEGDGFKVLRGGKQEICGGVWHEKNTRKVDGFSLSADRNMRIGDEVCITSDTALAAKITARERRCPIKISGKISPSEPFTVTVSGQFGERDFVSPFVAEKAKTCPFSESDFRACFSKTDEFPFTVVFGATAIEGDCFVLKSQLNAFRRSVLSAVYTLLAGSRPALSKRRIAQSALNSSEDQIVQHCPEIAVIDRDFSSKIYSKVSIQTAIFKPDSAKNVEDFDKFIKIAKYYAWNKLLYLPAYCTGQDLDEIEPMLHLFDGIYSDGAYAIEFCRQKGIALFAGLGFNLFNKHSARVLCEEGTRKYCLSKELSSREIVAMREHGSYVLVGGCIKVMELGHCPFRRDCGRCDRKRVYELEDEGGRVFPLLRREEVVCRFELYNSALLLPADLPATNRLYDFSVLNDEQKLFYLGYPEKRDAVVCYTCGAFKNGIR